MISAFGCKLAVDKYPRVANDLNRPAKSSYYYNQIRNIFHVYLRTFSTGFLLLFVIDLQLQMSGLFFVFYRCSTSTSSELLRSMVSHTLVASMRKLLKCWLMNKQGIRFVWLYSYIAISFHQQEVISDILWWFLTSFSSQN